MHREKISSRPLVLWLAAAAFAPALSLCRGNWAGVFLASAVLGALNWLVLRYCADSPGGSRWIALAQWAWLAVTVGSLLPYAAEGWNHSHGIFLPLLMLALAALASIGGASRAARIGTVTAWGVIAFFTAILLSGYSLWDGSSLRAQQALPDASACLVLLLPAAAGLLRRDRGAARAAVWVAAITAASGVVLVAGISQNLCETGEGFALYSESITLFGVAQRFEALTAAFTFCSWFLLFTFFLTCAAEQWVYATDGRHLSGVLLAAAAAAGMLILQISASGELLFFVCGILWVLLPILHKSGKSLKKVLDKGVGGVIE